MEMKRILQQREFTKANFIRACAAASKAVDSRESAEALKHRLYRIKVSFDHLMELSEDLCRFYEEPDYVDPKDDLEDFEEKYYAAYDKLMEATSELRRIDTNTTMDSNNPLLTTMVESVIKDDLHFERIKIPTFTGNYEDWCQFSDLFKGSVGSKQSLSKCQKFHYLKSYLDGDALKLVKHITVTNDNYDKAWEKLEQRYNKKPLIVRSFITNFLNLPTAMESTVHDLRKLVDGADEVIRGLSALSCESRDPWLIHILSLKLDTDTRQVWAEHCNSKNEEMTINDFLKFLTSRCDALEACQSINSYPSQNRRRTIVHHTTVQRTADSNCALCKENHFIAACIKFKELDLKSRRAFINKSKLCFNCLGQKHIVKDCKSKFNCRLCNLRHHTLVHVEPTNNSNVQIDTSHRTSGNELSSNSRQEEFVPVVTNHHTSEVSRNITTHALLPTVLATVIDAWGNRTTCRMLIDTGSSITLATEAFIQRIGVGRTHARIAVAGLAANSAGVTRGRAKIQLYSRNSSHSVEITALIMSALTSSIPAQGINTNSTLWKQICQMELADPSFCRPIGIDVILGSDQLWSVYTGELKTFGKDNPVAINTKFGWIIAGSYIADTDSSLPETSYHAYENIDTLVRSFLEIDNVQPSRATIEVSDPVEQHFIRTHTRTKNGVYVVNYPFKEGAPSIGSTLPQAIQRFNSLEKQFRKNSELKQQYVEFMEDYLHKGHMEQLSPAQINENPHTCVYLAHHAVLKPGNTTTKCRVVFDGSGKDEIGYSLNDRLHIGPPIQRDLLGVCLRFRQHRFVLCADIEKMFRRILVTPEHTNYQRIIWRKDENTPYQHFRLLRVICYCYRFVNHLRQIRVADDQPQSIHITALELQHARNQLIKYIQRTFFRKDFEALTNRRQLSVKSRLIRLTPFLDEDGLMRVGGRVDHSSLSYNAKHPIIIPKQSPVAVLLVRDLHTKTLHAGIDGTFNHLRQQYWILGARNIVRKVVFRCKACFMQKRATSSQLMGNLPVPRVQPLRCFLHTGLDYAGPIAIKKSTGRTPKFGKAWFAVFVCLSTKAIHLELVSDLTSAAFIAALQRFWSRRGPITDLYSDNGTTFQGAHNEITEMRQLVIRQSQDKELANFVAGRGIQWHFIPPFAPHFGGIWESCVRSIKLHLRRVVGAHVLTFEEYSTVLAQIEGILNSRPLCAASDTSFDPLTPSHFLVGESHTSIPQPSLLEMDINRLQRWKQLQAMVQGFWKRWHMEYLTTLQPRNKWQRENLNLQQGTLVVIKDPQMPPSKWMLGRIAEVHAGQDEMVRVVSIRTARGIVKRSITKVAVLPLF